MFISFKNPCFNFPCYAKRHYIIRYKIKSPTYFLRSLSAHGYKSNKKKKFLEIFFGIIYGKSRQKTQVLGGLDGFFGVPMQAFII